MDIQNDNPVSAGRRRGVARMKKHNLKTDMTPMVDLGFLLITFFVMTIRMSEPVVNKLNMPKDGPLIELGMSNALTVLLDKDNTIYCYHGDWETALANNQITKTTFDARNGIGKMIREKQQALDVLQQSNPDNPKLEGRKGLMLLIKASTYASYSNIIDLLDETTINKVGKYALLDLDPKELNYINQQRPAATGSSI